MRVPFGGFGKSRDKAKSDLRRWKRQVLSASYGTIETRALPKTAPSGTFRESL